MNAYTKVESVSQAAIIRNNNMEVSLQPYFVVPRTSGVSVWKHLFTCREAAALRRYLSKVLWKVLWRDGVTVVRSLFHALFRRTPGESLPYALPDRYG